MRRETIEKPVTFSHDTLHSVANHLALIVSYANLLTADAAPSDRQQADLVEIRKAACAAAKLLERPLAGTE
jgi:hypothetical protein